MMNGNVGAELLGSLGDPLFCCLYLGWGEEKGLLRKGLGTEESRVKGEAAVCPDCRTSDKLHLQTWPASQSCREAQT